MTKQVSASYKPFELNRVVDETDLIFIGKVIGLSEYDVQWKDENGESWGPYRNAVIEVKINDVYYGNTDTGQPFNYGTVLYDETMYPKATQNSAYYSGPWFYNIDQTTNVYNAWFYDGHNYANTSGTSFVYLD